MRVVRPQTSNSNGPLFSLIEPTTLPLPPAVRLVTGVQFVSLVAETLFRTRETSCVVWPSRIDSNLELCPGHLSRVAGFPLQINSMSSENFDRFQ